MKNLSLKWFHFPNPLIIETGLIFVLISLLWPLGQYLMIRQDATAGYLDPGILLLILVALIAFFIVVGLSVWLLQRVWWALDLPQLSTMVLQFKSLELWQQLGFYWASFALLLLAAVGCLIAIC